MLCEGQTEREFCRSVVGPGLGVAGVSVAGTLVGRPGRKRGGIREWPVYRKELLRLAKERHSRVVGVLVDYYAMPESWPGRAEAARKASGERGRHVEQAVADDLSAELGDRFVPCVQLHEFEALMFVAPDVSARSLENRAKRDGVRIERELAGVVEECGGSVELIDDSPLTAPSKRIAAIVPRYDKVAWGVVVAGEAGLDRLRMGCPWLDRWLRRLEALGEV